MNTTKTTKKNSTLKPVSLQSSGRSPQSNERTSRNNGKTANNGQFTKGNKCATVNKGKPKTKSLMKQTLKALAEYNKGKGTLKKDRHKTFKIDVNAGLEQFIPILTEIIGKGLTSKNRKEKAYWATQILPYTNAKLTKNENTNKNLTVTISKSGKKVKEMELTDPKAKAQETAGASNDD